MSRAVVIVTLHLDRRGHNRTLDAEDARQMIEENLEGAAVFDEADNEYEISVVSAEVTVNKQKAVLQ